MTDFVANVEPRRAVRRCVILGHTAYGRIALFSEPYRVVFQDLMLAYDGAIPWDTTWNGPADAIKYLAGFSSNIVAQQDLFSCLVSVTEISRAFQADPEASQAQESGFQVTLAEPAPRMLEDGIDNIEVEIWEYNESVADATQIANGVVTPSTIQGDFTEMSFQTTSRSVKFAKADVLDYKVRYADFQQAPYQSFGNPVPTVYGSVPKFLLLLVDQGPTAELKTALLDQAIENKNAEIDIGPGNPSKFPEHGSLADPSEPFKIIVDDEVIGIRRNEDAQNTSGKMIGIRAQGSVTHELKALVRHFSPELEWAISEFGIKALSNIEGRPSDGKVIRPSQAPTIFQPQQTVFDNLGISIATARYVKESAYSSFNFREAVATDARAAGSILVNFVNYNILNVSYYRTLETDTIDGSQADKMLHGEDCHLYFDGARADQYPGAEIVEFTAPVGFVNLPPIPASILSKTSVNLYYRPDLSVGDDRPIFNISLFLHLLSSSTTTSGFGGQGDVGISSDISGTDCTFFNSDIQDLSDVNALYLTLKHTNFYFSNGEKLDLFLSGKNTDGDAEQLHLSAEYDFEFIVNGSYITDDDRDNFASLFYTGRSTFPLVGSIIIGFGKRDIGSRVIVNASITLRAHISIGAGSYVKIKMRSYLGDTVFITMPTNLGADANPDEYTFVIANQDPFDPVYFTQEFIQSTDLYCVVEVKSVNEADVVEIYGLDLKIEYSKVGYIFSLFNTPLIADVDGVPDSIEATDLADGTITGTADALIENPADVAKAIAILNHTRPVSEIDDSFSHARDYYNRLADEPAELSATSSGAGYVVAGSGHTPNAYRGYVLKDENDETYYINSNSATTFYLSDGRIPKSGGTSKVSIRGKWKFGGAITGEIGSYNLWGDFQKQFCCRISEDVIANAPKLRFLYPLWNVTADPVARIFGEDGEAHASLPSFMMSGSTKPTFSRAEDPVRKVTVLYRKRYLKASDQSSDWEKTIVAESSTLAYGREIIIEAAYISDHYTARLLAQCILELFGTQMRKWEIEAPPDAFQVIRWGSVIEVMSSKIALSRSASILPKKFQVVGMRYTPGHGGFLTCLDRPIFGDGAFTEL